MLLALDYSLHIVSLALEALLKEEVKFLKLGKLEAERGL